VSEFEGNCGHQAQTSSFHMPRPELLNFRA
jgi:hypothetical protein